MELAQEVRELFAEEMAAKFLATVDPEGRPNVALIVTLQPPPDGRADRLIFGEFLMWRTREYLEGNPRVAAAVVDPKLRMASLTGDFAGFERTGPYKEALDASSLMRYNAYSGMRAAGVIEVREAFPARRASMATVPLGYLAVRLRRARDAAGGAAMPEMVREKFLRLTSVKALAVMGEDGYPRIHPVMAVAAAGESAFVLGISGYNRELARLRAPCAAALCVLTLDIKSYKVKGELIPLGPRALLFRVCEVFNAMPPLAGDLITSC